MSIIVFSAWVSKCLGLNWQRGTLSALYSYSHFLSQPLNSKSVLDIPVLTAGSDHESTGNGHAPQIPGLSTRRCWWGRSCQAGGHQGRPESCSAVPGGLSLAAHRHHTKCYSYSRNEHTLLSAVTDRLSPRILFYPMSARKVNKQIFYNPQLFLYLISLGWITAQQVMNTDKL